MSKTIGMLVAAAVAAAGVGWFGNSTAPSLDIVCRNANTGNVVYRVDADSVKKQLSNYVSGDGIADSGEITSMGFQQDGRKVRLVASYKLGNNSLNCNYEQAPKTPKD